MPVLRLPRQAGTNRYQTVSGMEGLRPSGLLAEMDLRVDGTQGQKSQRFINEHLQIEYSHPQVTGRVGKIRAWRGLMRLRGLEEKLGANFKLRDKLKCTNAWEMQQISDSIRLAVAYHLYI